MTGIECLKEELAKRGLTKTQIESKTAAVCLDVLANASGEYLKLCEIEKARDIAVAQKIDALRTVKRLEETIEDLKHNEEKARKHWLEGEKAYLETVLKKLSECETAEGRDAIRIAQTFMNAVDVDTKYDNTAYIIGLASILSRWNTAPMDELRKINKKLPAPNDANGWRYTRIEL